MKKLLCVLAALCGFSALSHAAEKMEVGPIIGMRGGLNISKFTENTVPAFALSGMPDIGGSFFYQFNKDEYLGVGMDITYATLAYGVTTSILSTSTTNETHLNYLAFCPSFTANGFNIGLNFGIPVGATMVPEKGDDVELPTDDMATLIEVRLGGIFPIYKGDSGRLNFNTFIACPLTTMSKDGGDYDPRVLTFSLGFSYLFNISN